MKFFWFNDWLIRMYLRAKFRDQSITEHQFGSQSYRQLHDINLIFSDNPWGMQHDITDHVPHHFSIKTKTPYKYATEVKSWDEICLATAERISLSTDRDIAVLWSGGIDSTSALVALMQVLPPKRLSVVCTEHSIAEFPSFYHDKIASRHRVLSPKAWSQRGRDFFSVSGDGGDTVWGVLDDSFWKKNQQDINCKWQDIVPDNADHDFIQEFCSWSGTEINTYLDLRTWFYLCCKWQDKCSKIFVLNNELTDLDATAFYDLDGSFQQWTMNNLDKIIGNTWESYKMPAKRFINQWHEDLDYLHNKTKVDSVYLSPALQEKSIWQNYMRIALPENYQNISLPSWPVIDYAEIEDFNDESGLIPSFMLDGSFMLPES